jgi:hypothetical protein
MPGGKGNTNDGCNPPGASTSARLAPQRRTQEGTGRAAGEADDPPCWPPGC